MHHWRRPLIVACIFSVIVHAALMVGLPLQMPEKEQPAAMHVLEARLVPMRPAEPAIEPIKSPAKVLPPRKPRHRVRVPQQKQAQPIDEDQSIASVATAEAPPIASAEMPPITEGTSDEEPSVTTQTNMAAAAKPTEVISLPDRLLIRLSVNWGGLGVGHAEYNWQRQGSHYTLRSSMQSTGIIELFKSMRLVQSSSGEITANGLQPEIFVTERSGRPSESALFDWPGQSLKLTNGEQSQIVSLPAGTQDLLSVLFQFAFAPPTGEPLQLAVVIGRKLDTYRFSIIGEETLQLPFGAVRTLHVSRPKTEEDEGLDVWLAMGRHYLPVRILRIDRKDGRPIELLASELLVPAEDNENKEMTKNEPK